MNEFQEQLLRRLDAQTEAMIRLTEAIEMLVVDTVEDDIDMPATMNGPR